MKISFIKNLAYQFCPSVFFSTVSLSGNLSQAQITSDPTLSTNVNTSNTLKFTITGGRRVGDNLFHSFSQFSVPTGGAAIFDYTSNIKHIFSRVTGGSISHIDGLIRAKGNANLFLLNPNGIIFGSNARLNIGGSFIATTANQIDFAHGNSFSATDPQLSPLLTASIPIGLQFRETAKPIVNQSITTKKDNSGADLKVGLQVLPGKTLALVGGDILFDGGGLFAPAGKIELGSVAGNSFVGLRPISEGWALEYENVQNFQDIHLSQQALVKTTGKPSGNIRLQGGHIAFTDNSSIEAFNKGDGLGGVIMVKASESLELSDASNIISDNKKLSTGLSGDIIIETKKLIVRDDSLIDLSNQGGGRGGTLIVNASESVEIDSSTLTTQTFGGQNAGNLIVTTQRLILSNGGLITSSTTEAGGNGGDIIINANQSVDVSGQEIADGKVTPSALFASSLGDTTAGNGGMLTINTGRLIVREGGTISVAANKGSRGQAGNLKITANSLTLNRGFLTAETGKSGLEGANITLQLSGLLQLENESKISASAIKNANGGNITINSPFLLAFPPTGKNGSDIIANAVRGNGGNIDIDAQGIFGITERPAIPGDKTNDIDASSEFGATGQVQINSTIDPNRGVIQLPETVVDPTTLIAQNPCKKGTESQFTRTGRGGLPPNPAETLNPEITQVGLIEPLPSNQTQTPTPNVSAPQPDAILPAQGWIFNERGEVVLVAYNPTIPESQRPKANLAGCPAS